MWPFKSKQTDAEKMWDTLQGAPDPDAVKKMVKQIELGNVEEVEKIFKKHLADRVREIERNIRKS